MNYIIFDLEWNQASDKHLEHPRMAFEIIEIGAVKADESGRILGEFGQLVRPFVYPHLFERIRQVVGLCEADLEQARPFPAVWEEFLAWCGKDYIFCTWGPMDLTELEKNLDFYGIPNPLPRPLLYYDVQKLFSLALEEGTSRRALDYAAAFLNLPQEEAFHRALSDARYTWMVMEALDMKRLASMVSIDYHRPPRTAKEEIYLKFDRYSKFVSRVFPAKEDAMEDRNVTATVCFRCGRAARKKIRWFSSGSHRYLSLSYCPKHGWLRGKIRMKRADDGSGVFAVKTLKYVDESGAAMVFKKQEELRRKRRMKRLEGGGSVPSNDSESS